MDARRLAYLDALGIDVWLPRTEPLTEAPAKAGAAQRIILGDGDGDILCIAQTREQARLKLAADISRAMRTAPVWGWPAEGSAGEEGAVTVHHAVAEGLLTRVLVFGEELAEALFGAEVPAVLAAARIHVVPSLKRLGKDRDAKRILWGVMCEQGIAADRASGKMGT